jgi:hypothetical protein
MAQGAEQLYRSTCLDFEYRHHCSLYSPCENCRDDFHELYQEANITLDPLVERFLSFIVTGSNPQLITTTKEKANHQHQWSKPGSHHFSSPTSQQADLSRTEFAPLDIVRNINMQSSFPSMQSILTPHNRCELYFPAGQSAPNWDQQCIVMHARAFLLASSEN